MFFMMKLLNDLSFMSLLLQTDLTLRNIYQWIERFIWRLIPLNSLILTLWKTHPWIERFIRRLLLFNALTVTRILETCLEKLLYNWMYNYTTDQQNCTGLIKWNRTKISPSKTNTELRQQWDHIKRALGEGALKYPNL